ncbi:potassium channel family protein [Actinoallomurus sp. CA-150999]|uniref:potassium channel family protein n=1 Tax=Actinoallomurus sp. CA-150999 TaxID=3239887 RepID=UPI003D93EEDD
METVRRLRIAVACLVLVIVGGSLGYMLLGFTPLDAVYQTVTTVSTVGYREVRHLTPAGEIFTIFVILVGVGTALYTFGTVLEALLEGHVRAHLERRRMDRAIDRMSGHVIICGWGRVGQAGAQYLASMGHQIVVIDRDPDRLTGIEHAHVIGDVTEDQVLHEAGIARASALIAALETDADNVYVTLSSRALRPDLVIIARARNESSKSKLLRAGADRAVNPQLIGGRRMAAFALQPEVTEFLDVVMHDETLEFQIEQVEIRPESPLAGRTVREAALRESTGVLLLAIRTDTGRFLADPPPETPLEPPATLIAFGAPAQLDALRNKVEGAS